MIKQIYAIYDKKTNSYQSDLLTLDNDNAAMRWFDSYLHTVLDSTPNAVLVLYPDDFELCSLGTFDFVDGITALYDSPRTVCSASAFIVK